MILTEWPEDKSQVLVGAEPYFQMEEELCVQVGIIFRVQRAVVSPLLWKIVIKKSHTWALTAVLDGLKCVLIGWE